MNKTLVVARSDSCLDLGRFLSVVGCKKWFWSLDVPALESFLCFDKNVCPIDNYNKINKTLLNVLINLGDVWATNDASFMSLINSENLKEKYGFNKGVGGFKFESKVDYTNIENEAVKDLLVRLENSKISKIYFVCVGYRFIEGCVNESEGFMGRKCKSFCVFKINPYVDDYNVWECDNIIVLSDRVVRVMNNLSNSNKFFPNSAEWFVEIANQGLLGS
uniref:P25 n=1 Tax=croton golden spot associated virus A TaxID=3072821 RepID=A0AA51N1F1_9CLOS|nr:p25 [croton golden spot associated virus A]